MKKFFFLLTLLLLCGEVSAQELKIEKVQAPAAATLAQPFAVQYQISHTPGYEVTADEKSFPPAFEITQQAFARQSPQSGLYDLTVMPFTLGKSTFTVTFLLSKDGETTAIPADPVYLDIAAAKTFPDKKFREIRSPKIPAGWGTWLLILLLTALVIYGLLAWREHAQNKALRIQQRLDLRPNDEIALSQIDALLNSGLWERREYKLFYITLTDILREYLWRQFQTDTSADTSAELLRRVKTIPSMQPLLVSLREFLSSGDLVKFAKAIPEEAVRNKDIQILRQIVQQTSPKEAPAPHKEEKA